MGAIHNKRDFLCLIATWGWVFRSKKPACAANPTNKRTRNKVQSFEPAVVCNVRADLPTNQIAYRSDHIETPSVTIWLIIECKPLSFESSWSQAQRPLPTNQSTNEP